VSISSDHEVIGASSTASTAYRPIKFSQRLCENQRIQARRIANEVKNPQQTAGTISKSSDARRGDPAVVRPKKAGRSSARKGPDRFNLLDIAKQS
jgi:hypothetical protein